MKHIIEQLQGQLNALLEQAKKLEAAIQLLEGSPKKKRKRNTVPVADAILSVVKGQMKPKEIIAALPGHNASSIRQTLPRLVKAGKLKHDKAGKTYSKS